jgi:hypothetical protein
MCSLFSVAPHLHHSITSSQDIQQPIQIQQPGLTEGEVLVEGLGFTLGRRDEVRANGMRDDIIAALREQTDLPDRE